MGPLWRSTHGILVLFPPTTGYDASSLLSCPKGAWPRLSDEIVLIMLSCTRILPQSIARRFICSGLSREYVSTLARSLIWKVQKCLGHTLASSRPTACPTELRPQASLRTIRTKKVQTNLPGFIGLKHRDRFRQQFGSAAKNHGAHHTVRQLWASGLDTQTHALLGLFAYLPEVPQF